MGSFLETYIDPTKSYVSSALSKILENACASLNRSLLIRFSCIYRMAVCCTPVTQNLDPDSFCPLLVGEG